MGYSESPQPNGISENKFTKKANFASYEIFLKYINSDEQTSAVDVSGIFSQECFMEWVSTRPSKKLMHAAKSFQRVLYAHIRGADRRRPFAPDVEAELLRVLRDDRNPWENIFNNTNLGKRGFRSPGYHESLKSAAKERSQELSEDDPLTLNESPTASDFPADNESKRSNSNENVLSDLSSSKADETSHENLSSSTLNPLFLATLGNSNSTVSISRVTNPTKRKKQNKKSKFSQSFRIFMNHIKWENKASEVDVSDVFSRECFDSWLSSRITNEVKFPAKSYQRVLYAHIRGADKRKPFPEPIEKELLRFLRSEENPWKTLFKNEKGEIGKRGFSNKGFHESRQDSQMSESNSEPPEQDTLPEVSSTLTCSPRKESNKVISFSLTTAVPIEANTFFAYTLKPTPKSSTKPWDAVVNVMQQYLPVDVRKKSIVKMNERGVNIWTPAVFYFLNELVNPDDFRFSFSFIFPSVEEQFFRTDRPVAQLYFSSANIFTDQDNHADELFGGSLAGMHIFGVYASIVSLCFSFLRSIPKMREEGKIWRRDVLKKTDGGRMVCLVYLINTGSEYSMAVQDQSDLFPNVLSQVCFI